MTQKYPERSLDPSRNEIRILHLLPGAAYDEVQVELEVVSLDIFDKGPSFGSPYSEKNIDLHKRSHARTGEPEGHRLDLLPREHSLLGSWNASLCTATPCRCYEALSYTWDPKGKRQAISLNRESGYFVMENLFKALRRLRSKQERRTLWIDALCISQVDDGEKADQVRLMSRIFSSAARVIVWLGDTVDSSKPAQQSMLARLRLAKPSQQAVSVSADPRLLALQNALLNAERFWWDRAWIIQDFVLATNTPVFCFGSYLVEDAELLDLLNSIGNHQNRHPLRATLHDILILRTTFGAARKGQITRHVSLMRKAFATDPRDKVFSILGMVHEAEAKQVRVEYTPTYSTAQVYARATCISMHSSQCLEPLRYITFRARDTSLPSWTIDFDCADPIMKQVAIPDWRPWQSGWCSSNPSPKPWDDLNFDFDKVQLCGYSLDKVRHVVPFPLRTLFKGRFDGDPLPPQPAAMLEWIKALRDLPPADPYTVLSRQGLQASSRTPVDWNGLLRTAQAMPESDLTALRWLEKLFYAWTDALSRSPSLISLRTHRVGLLNGWVRYAQFAAADTVAFTTEKGFLGMAPSTIEAGDEIALLFGSNAPTLLRPSGPEWLFRGFGHVWGVSVPNSEPKLNMLAALAPNVVLQERRYTLK